MGFSSGLARVLFISISTQFRFLPSSGSVLSAHVPVHFRFPAIHSNLLKIYIKRKAYNRTDVVSLVPVSGSDS